MKKTFFAILLFLLILPAMVTAQVHGTVFGQGINGQSSLGVRNDDDATVNPLNLGWGNFSVTASGKIKIDPGTSATSLGKTEDAAAASGDTGVAQLLKRTDTAAAQTNTDGDYTVPVANSVGAQHVNIDSTFQATAATGILKAGQSTSANTDSGTNILAVRAATVFGPADRTGGVNKYGPLQVDGAGALIVHPVFGSSYGGVPSMRVSTADTNAYNFSGGQTNLVGFIACNTTAVTKYLKFYDKGTAPSCGSDTVKMEYFIPPNTINPCTAFVFGPVGTYFTAGGSYCITGAADVTDTTAIGAGDVYLTVWSN